MVGTRALVGISAAVEPQAVVEHAMIATWMSYNQNQHPTVQCQVETALVEPQVVVGISAVVGMLAVVETQAAALAYSRKTAVDVLM